MNHHVFATDDEALSALLDGALPAADTERLRQRLASDAALAARLRELERANEAVRRAYAGVVDEPVPVRVLELLTAPKDADHGNVIALGPRRQALPWFTLPLAAAASVALAIGLSLGVWLGPRTSGPDALGLVAAGGDVAPGTALDDVLQRAPSATTRALTAQISATPRLTFGAVDGRYCRLVDLAGERGTTEVLACRGDAGWRLELVSFTAAVQPGPGGLYRPASGPSTPLDAAIDEQIDGAPLDAATERELIERDWENTAPPAN
jgi:anti-sigma factor RsiW